ncbi:MAG: thymidylate kinase [Candidatus Paceibacterota bacterium]
MGPVDVNSHPAGKLIALEGVDASGKSTQIDQLMEWLRLSGVPLTLFSFPRTDGPGFGEVIAKFLRGELGAVDAVNPFLIAAVFAADRLSAKPEISAALENSETVIVDRYVHSNIAFQCAKTSDPVEKQKLKQWVIETEFTVNDLPRPDIVVYLRVPEDFVRDVVSKRSCAQREYLKGSQDIHEHAFDLQRQVAVEYERMLESDPVMRVVDCVDETGKMKPPNEISTQLISTLQKVLDFKGAPAQ